MSEQSYLKQERVFEAEHPKAYMTDLDLDPEYQPVVDVPEYVRENHLPEKYADPRNQLWVKYDGDDLEADAGEEDAPERDFVLHLGDSGQFLQGRSVKPLNMPKKRILSPITAVYEVNTSEIETYVSHCFPNDTVDAFLEDELERYGFDVDNPSSPSSIEQLYEHTRFDGLDVHMATNDEVQYITATLRDEIPDDGTVRALGRFLDEGPLHEVPKPGDRGSADQRFGPFFSQVSLLPTPQDEG